MGTAAINPAFTTQGSRPLPVFFGYASASGDTMIPYIIANGTELNYIAICDGEWDGVEQACYTPGGYFSSTRLTPSTFTPSVNAILQNAQVYVHNGQWTPIGIPQIPFSTGSDQGYDSLFGNIPTVTPPQAFNNIGYIALERVPVSGILERSGYTNPTDPLAFYGILRGARCRYFDSSGNVTGYGFTTNPTWHIMEALLRYKFKRQQPQIAGLTTAEKACFNWPAIVAHAAYNDGVLANGAKRYTGNYVFASQGTLAAMLETMLRCCQSYLDDQDGQIGLYHYQAQSSTFTLTANHLADPSSFKTHKKDLTNAPNIFVPKFRDLNIQALIPVTNLTISNTGGTPDASGYTPFVTSGLWGATFETNGQNPFVAGSVFFYGDGSNPALNHDYVSIVTPNPPTGTPSDPAPNVWAWVPGDISAAATSTGGYIGTQSSRFGQRSPNTVQHSRHQLATGNVAPGVASLPNRKPVEYDLGNMSYDQANRLMQYQMNSQLGNDAPGWIAPVVGTMKLRLECVDAAGNMFVRMRPGQRFTIDETISPELVAQGITDFLIDNGPDAMKVIPPSKSEPLGVIEISFHQYNASAFTDTSYTPDSSLQTIASAALQYVNSSVQIPNVAWVVQATPSITTATDGTLTLTIPDLTLQILGNTAYTTFGRVVWTEIPSGVASVLFYNPYTGGAIVAAGTIAGLEAAGTMPANSYPILAGTFTSTVF